MNVNIQGIIVETKYDSCEQSDFDSTYGIEFWIPNIYNDFSRIIWL